MDVEIQRMKDRLERLEYIVFKKYLEKCPRCGVLAMGYQKDFCSSCAHHKGDPVFP